VSFSCVQRYFFFIQTDYNQADPLSIIMLPPKTLKKVKCEQHFDQFQMFISKKNTIKNKASTSEMESLFKSASPEEAAA